MNDLISIIVPVYNAERYIGFCISSILKQTYENFELILINDGSQDRSLELCQDFSAKDGRIKVFSRENGGASAARNTGLENMRGRYVIFIDCDDYVSASYLENLYRAMQSGPYDIVQCNLKKTNTELTSVHVIPFKLGDVKEITKIQALNKRKYKVSVWGKIYSAHIFDNFRFKEGIIYEDDASYYIFIDRAERIAVLNETLYYYFMSENSVMRNNKDNKSTAFIEIYEERIRYFKARNNQLLLDGTYARFCLVLMLTILSSEKDGKNRSDLARFSQLFKQFYPMAMRAQNIKITDKIMFICFRFSSKIIRFFFRLIGEKHNGGTL